jgi:ribosome-binding factor A
MDTAGRPPYAVMFRFQKAARGFDSHARNIMPQNTKKFGLRDDQANAKGPSQRMLRVGELVRHKMAEMLARGEIHDPVLSGYVITIPEVRMAPDLKLATIYVMPLGGKDIAKILAALERNKRFIRGEIAHTLALKFAPDVRFREDESFAEATRIDQLLDSPKVKQDLGKG